MKDTLSHCYKVVRMIEDHLESVIAQAEAALLYEIGQKTEAEFGLIFVFKNLEDARNFRYGASDELILKCLCAPLEYLDTGTDGTSPIEWLKRFWAGDTIGLWTGDTSYGTRGTKWVIPEKIVEGEYGRI